VSGGDLESAIRTLLGEAGLPATDPEVAGLARAHRAYRAAVDALHAAPGADVDPVLLRAHPS
jgi:hypothetical protein